MTMIKTIRIGLEKSEHAEFEAIKGERTWYAVMVRGISSIENFPDEISWTRAILNKVDDEHD